MKKAEKEAERIIEMFKPFANYYVDLNSVSGIVELEENALQCALLHVEGIIDEWNSKQHYDYIAAEYVTCKVLFWQEVKQIITNKQV